jgi:putative addiction module component (TIGR02574 family)
VNEPAKRILDEALKLSIPQRAEVAAELLASLDGEPEPDAEAAWTAEIEQRFRRIRSGQANGRPWAEIHDAFDRRKQ